MMMQFRLLLLPLALLAGCLKGGRDVVGFSLVRGRAVEKPAFVKDGAWVTYELRRRSAEAPFSGAYDFAMVNYDTGEVRPLVENVADRWGRQDSDTGIQYLVADETASPSGTMGTLVLLDLDQGVQARIPDVTSFQPLRGTREFFYRVVTPDSKLATLRYRSQDGTDRPLGLSSGGVEFRSNRLYFLTSETDEDRTKTWSRITRPDGPIEVLRTRVNRFQLQADEKWAILQTTDAGNAQIVARDLESGKEKVIPESQNAYWMDFSDHVFLYIEAAAAGVPARIHTYDVVTEQHTVTSAPAGLVDVRDMRGRPNSTDRLLFDSQGQLAVVAANGVDAHLIAGNPQQLTVTEDGKYAIYIELAIAMPPQGRLMIQDLDFRDAPRLLSPRGGQVPVPGFFFIRDNTRPILVFWAQFGHNGVDLYYANHETGDQRVVAEGISEVVVTPHQIVGIVRVSEQDLIGDLVNKDLVLDKEIILAHEVAEESVHGDRVVFVIRERVSSERDGLWAIGIDGTSPDAGVIAR
jgi:hypothetical protein